MYLTKDNGEIVPWTTGSFEVPACPVCEGVSGAASGRVGEGAHFQCTECGERFFVGGAFSLIPPGMYELQPVAVDAAMRVRYVDELSSGSLGG